MEVPDERFRLKWLGPARFYKLWFNELAQCHFMAPFVNALVRWRQPPPDNMKSDSHADQVGRAAVSSLMRRLPPIEDLALHEHINFFTTRSLERLALRFGFRAIRTQRESGVLRLLAERQTPSRQSSA